MKEYYETLLSCILFDNFTQDNLETVLECFKPTVSDYQKGEILILDGYKNDYVHIILSGTVSGIKVDFNGKERIISIFSKGDVFGEILSGSTEKNPITIIANEQCTVLKIEHKKIISPCGKFDCAHSLLLQNLISSISDKYFKLNSKLEILSSKTLREKIIVFLLTEQKKAGQNTFMIIYNRNNLATYLNCDRTALSRELASMKADGLIDYYKNSFKIDNIPNLKKQL